MSECRNRVWCSCPAHSHRYVLAASARAMVNRAIKRGDIPSPEELTCVDCGMPASQYDHRDYDKPTEIWPVCRKCNKKRGQALPLIREGGVSAYPPKHWNIKTV